ncbi:hypothetical protein L208DRAFT_1402790, partial [Tricholoma matsutake]
MALQHRSDTNSKSGNIFLQILSTAASILVGQPLPLFAPKGSVDQDGLHWLDSPPTSFI